MTNSTQADELSANASYNPESSNPEATTQEPSAQQQRATFYQLMAEAGVAHVHGIELLRLVKMCAGAYDRILGEQMRNERISHPQWRMLIRLYLAEHEGQESLSPTDLAHSQRLSKNTISAHLRTLEEAQLIQRELDPGDLRAFRICLTEHARELIRTSTPRHIEFLNQLADGLSEAQSEQLQELLAKLYESIVESSSRK